MLKIELLKGKRLLSPRPQARLEAELLLAKASRRSRLQIYQDYNIPLSRKHKSLYHRFLKRRKQGVPLSYLLGEKEFWSLTFKVGPGVLIPRPDTETLVAGVLSSAARVKGELNILDLGTGSGILPVSLAKYLPQARFWAIDKSAQALKYARHNAEALGVKERITFEQGHWFESLKSKSTFNYIISNPPYVAIEDWKKLPLTIRGFEPKFALVAGTKGLKHLKAIISGSPGYLKPGGELWLEIGRGQSAAVVALLQHYGFKEIEGFKDLSGKIRVVKGKI
jgi:release factor glutamine methyltransferase